jgi:hypothetical protein
MRPETIAMEVPIALNGAGKLEVVDRFVEKTVQVAGYVSGKWKIQGALASDELALLRAEQYGTLQFVAGTKKIIRTVGDWTAAGSTNYSRAGTRISIAGSALNDGTYTVASATATDLVVVESLVDEAASATEGVRGFFDYWQDIGSEIAGNGLVSIAYTLLHLRLLCSLAVGGGDAPPVFTFGGLDARAV